jgi:hypothetical protein
MLGCRHARSDEKMDIKAWFRKRTAKREESTPAEEAYRAFKCGELVLAAAEFDRLVEQHPDRSDYAYMLGLAHKYQRNWSLSLAANLRAIELEPEEGSRWNAGIAATALGDWMEARRQWVACGIAVDPGEGPIEENYGTVSLRINPWANAETLYARRIDPARAYLMNVPLPKSGYRFGDLVLHDGAKTGERQFGGKPVPVFNAMQRLQQSDFLTFAVFVSCPTAEDCDDLCDRNAPGIGLVEDWSGMSYYCLRCSYGSPHAHDKNLPDGDWDPERSIGVAAQSRTAVESLLAKWAEAAPGRLVESIELTQHELTEPETGSVWWREPDPNVEETA